jgi:type III secretory pathway component EscR
MENETVTEMNMLLEDIRNASGVDQLKAELALGAVMSFLGSRLPSPIMGRIKEVLSHSTEIKELGNAHE